MFGIRVKLHFFQETATGPYWKQNRLRALLLASFVSVTVSCNHSLRPTPSENSRHTSHCVIHFSIKKFGL